MCFIPSHILLVSLRVKALVYSQNASVVVTVPVQEYLYHCQCISPIPNVYSLSPSALVLALVC